MAAPGIAVSATDRTERPDGGRDDRYGPALPARVGAPTRAPVRESRDGGRTGGRDGDGRGRATGDPSRDSRPTGRKVVRASSAPVRACEGPAAPPPQAPPPLPAPDPAADDLALPCRSHDPDLWFAERPVHLDRAKELCRGCPIRAACLDGALARSEPWGVWGGEIVENGVVLAHKRGRGRPPKNAQHERPAR